MGNYSIAFAAVCESLGLEPWTSTCTPAQTLALGTAAVPESVCLPLKAYTGHFIKAAQEGVEYGMMVNSIGFCRLRYYVPMQQKVLRDLGYSIRVFGLGYDGIKPPMFRYFDPTIRASLAALSRMWQKTRAVDEMETRAWFCRAREVRPGATTTLMRNCLEELHRRRTTGEIRRFRKTLRSRFAGIGLDSGRKPLKVGLLGEAAVLRDRLLNQNLEETLGSLGVQVQNFYLLGPDVMNIFKLGIGNKYSTKNQFKVARPYLNTEIGGHALDSVANTIRCQREGFDGVIHVCPTGCMPEISVRPIVRRVGRDLDFPVLELSFDEHTSYVGVQTRLESFCDILRARRNDGTSGS